MLCYGSIQAPTAAAPGEPGYWRGAVPLAPTDDAAGTHRPALNVDLSTMLPLIVQQLIFGKGRGRQFVEEQVSRVRRAACDDDAKAVIREVVRDNFFPELRGGAAEAEAVGAERSAKHLQKVVEWFYAALMRRAPWQTWTVDIYDAMRCIDHLPIG
jgi:hypothetical protein